jgi:hypothetical protein
MRKLYLPNRVPYLLGAEHNPALLHVSLRLWPQNNDCEWMRGTRPKEMRLFSIRAAAVADGAEACCLSNAQVFRTSDQLVGVNLALPCPASGNASREELEAGYLWRWFALARSYTAIAATSGGLGVASCSWHEGRRPMAGCRVGP